MGRLPSLAAAVTVLAWSGLAAVVAQAPKEPVAVLKQPELVTSVALSPDGKTLAVGTRNKLVKLWDLAGKTELKTLEGHDLDVNALAFSADGKTLASGSFYTFRLWDVATGKLLHTLKGHVNQVDSVAFSPDGKMLVTGSGDRTVRFWDTRTGKERGRFDPTGGQEPFACLALSPDGKTLACAGEATLRLWNAATRRPGPVLLNHKADVTELAYSPDGKYLASAGKTVRVWDLKTNKLVHSFALPDDTAFCLTLTSDSKAVAAATFGGDVFLWDLKSGKQLARIKAHEENIGGLAITPDGKRLLTGSNDETVKVWDVTGVLGGKGQ